jgi:hypothetical protein
VVFKGTVFRPFFFLFFSLALQPQFGPWPTSMKLSVSLRFTRSETFGRTPWAGDQLVARPLPVHKHRKTHIHTLNISALSDIRTHGSGFRASEDSACLRPLGYRDRLFRQCILKICHLVQKLKCKISTH